MYLILITFEVKTTNDFYVFVRFFCKEPTCLICVYYIIGVKDIYAYLQILQNLKLNT